VYDRAKASAVMTMNMNAKTNSIVPVITAVRETMRTNVRVERSLSELLVRVQVRLFQSMWMRLGFKLGMLVQGRCGDVRQWEGWANWNVHDRVTVSAVMTLDMNLGFELGMLVQGRCNHDRECECEKQVQLCLSSRRYMK
jgi:hypothetical protein